MALEDLEDLGYTVTRPPEGETPNGAVVSGYGKWWHLAEDQDEQDVVTEATNHKKLADKLIAAQTYFADSYANWPTMTNAQKDVAMRNAMRALSNLIRHVRGDLASEGV